MNAAVFIGLTLAVTLSVLLMLPLATAQKTVADICMDADTRDKTRALMFEGINIALVHHTERLFDNLMKDRGNDPERMTRGMYAALALYARSRENLLRWNPPPCKE
jgi:hypothetical protein